VAYIYRGGVTYIQVKRLIGSPPALPRVTAPEPPAAEPRPATASTAGPAAPRAASPAAAACPPAASPDGAARPPITPPAWATRALGPVWPLPAERRPAPSGPPARQPPSAPEGPREQPESSSGNSSENSAAWPPAPAADRRPPSLTAFLDAAFGPEPAALPRRRAADAAGAAGSGLTSGASRSRGADPADKAIEAEGGR
jgi:translation initiation factor IF-2